MKPTFEKTVDILVKAYLNDTLEHGNYCACAVGNLISDAVGAEIYTENPRSASALAWKHPIYNGSEWYNKTLQGRNQVKKTGYSFEEIWRIEKAFESVRRNYCTRSDDELMFDGLIAVVDVLAEIHNVDLSVREEAKALFVKV